MRRRLIFFAMPLIAAGLSSCATKLSSDHSSGGWEREARMVAGSTETPKHSLPKTEYPFDDDGNYLASWAARGESRFGKAHSTWAAVVSPAGDGAVAAQLEAITEEESELAGSVD